MARLDSFEKFGKHAEAAIEELALACYSHSKELCEKILPKLSFDPKWVTVIKNPIYYRCYNKAFQPFSVLGAIADGARFNIGGSQAGGPAKTLGPLASKRGAIYLSESWETTLLEAFSEVAPPAASLL